MCPLWKAANDIHPLHPQVFTASWRLDETLPQTFWCRIQEMMWSWSSPDFFLEYQSSLSIPLFFSWGGEQTQNWFVVFKFMFQHLTRLSTCGAGLSSSTWCCVFKDGVKESSLTRLRAAAEPLSLWSGSPSRSSLPCMSPTWARSSVSSEESVPSSSLSSLVCQHPWPMYLCLSEHLLALFCYLHVNHFELDSPVCKVWDVSHCYQSVWWTWCVCALQVCA